MYDDAIRSALDEVGQLTEVPNFERGCGSLDRSATYLRADVPAFAAPDGEIPTFVEFDRSIPYREGHFRTFKRINGTEFLLEATKQYAEEPENESVAHRERVLTDRPPATELPEDEVLSYVERAAEGDLPENGSPALGAMNSMDLLMWVGKSHYETPAEFIREARTQGVNKKIPTSGNQEPPRIRPFRTRLFLIHPRAIPTGLSANAEEMAFDPTDPDVERFIVNGEYDFPLAEVDEDGESDGRAWTDQAFIPGIVGYTYLTRAIHTADVEGEHPEWAREYEEAGLLDRVDVADFTPRDDGDHPDNDEGDEPVASDDQPDESAEDGARDDGGDEGPDTLTTDPDGDVTTVAARERAFRESGLSFQILRKKASEEGLNVGQNPSMDDVVRALAESDVPAPEVREA
jgi:hypothetical protein